MYINKVIFMEWNEIRNLDTKYTYHVVQSTDYGTTEIVGSSLQCLIEDLKIHTNEYNFTLKELMEDLNNTLGTDVVEMLLNDKLDFILVV